MQLQIECTNVCNADCVFCPYSKMVRPKGTMPMDLFCRIIDEAATIPAFESITITGLGEPLLDRFLVDRILYIRSRLPNVLLDLFTNGSFLRPALSEQLIDAGMSVIYVSLNAVSARKRMAVMKLDDFDRVLAYIKHAQEYAVAKGNGCRVVVKTLVAKDLMEADETSQFIDFWKGDWDKGGAGFRHLEGNWAGSMWNVRVPLEGACARAIGQFMVLQDGRVSLCCFDAEGRETLGDLNHQTIREVFNGERATFIRDAHYEGRRNDVALCANCTGI